MSRSGLFSSLLLTTLSMAQSIGAVAANAPGFEITPFVGYRGGGQFRDGTTDSTRDLSASSSTALAINWRTVEPGSQYELTYSRQSTDTDDSSPVKMKIEYLQVGGTTTIGEPDGRVVPFAVGGFGAARFTPGPASFSQETRWSFNLGGGVRVPLAQHVRLRVEARGYLTWLGGQSDLFCQGSCALVAKGKTFFQYEALAGVSFGF